MNETTTATLASGVRRALLCCLVPVVMVVAACSSGGTSADSAAAIGDPVADTSAADDPVADEADEVSWLASQTAEGGRIEFTDGEATRLVLDGVDPHTIMFSDRPDRLTDVVDTAAITEQWDEMFADSAPNAVLVEHRPEGETDSLVVVLSNPVFDAASLTLSYDIEVLADEDHPESVSGLTGEVHDEVPAQFRAASLFIDNMTYEEDEKSRTDGYIDDKDEDAGDSIDDGADAVEDRADEMPD